MIGQAAVSLSRLDGHRSQSKRLSQGGQEVKEGKL